MNRDRAIVGAALMLLAVGGVLVTRADESGTAAFAGLLGLLAGALCLMWWALRGGP